MPTQRVAKAATPSNGPGRQGAAPSRVGLVIAAAGQSRRMQGTDKLFVTVAGKPLLAHTIETCQRSPLVDCIALVLREELVAEWRDRAGAHGWDKVTAVVAGGARRQDSVLAGLRGLGPCDWVLVHDGARPCVTHEIIQRGLDSARETGAAIAAVPPKDTIKVVGPGDSVSETLPRESLWSVQTPQVFRYDLLLEAYETSDGDVTDDASLVEQAGHQVKVFMGDYTNIKVTTQEDVAVAELFLKSLKRSRKKEATG